MNSFGTKVIEFAVVFLLGSLTAIAELISRYRDDPTRALLNISAGIYVGVNGAASVGALALIRSFGWTFGVASTSQQITQVLAAGFGSVALFRTSLLNITVSNQVIGIGPSVILTVILTAADRAVDRKRARVRSDMIADIMSGVDFDRDAYTLQKFCFSAMQNLSANEQDEVSNDLQDLQSELNKNVPSHVKSYIFGLSLLTLVGKEVLRSAVTRIKPLDAHGEIVVPGTDPTPAGSGDR